MKKSYDQLVAEFVSMGAPLQQAKEAAAIELGMSPGCVQKRGGKSDGVKGPKRSIP